MLGDGVNEWHRARGRARVRNQACAAAFAAGRADTIACLCGYVRLGRAGGHVLVHGRNVERTAAAAAALASEDGVTGRCRHTDGQHCGLRAACTLTWRGACRAGKFTPVTGDLSNGEGAAALIAAVDAIGELEVLVNNVGIFEVRDFTKVQNCAAQKRIAARTT